MHSAPGTAQTDEQGHEGKEQPQYGPIQSGYEDCHFDDELLEFGGGYADAKMQMAPQSLEALRQAQVCLQACADLMHVQYFDPESGDGDGISPAASQIASRGSAVSRARPSKAQA